MTVIVVAIAALVVLAAIALFAVTRRRDTERATGVLSRETLRRDRGRLAPSERQAVVTSPSFDRQ